MANEKQKIIVILGPTATGKSDLAVALAKERNGEVISADSRQVYRELDIGTGKITKEEMGGIPHYLLDVADPKRQFSVAQYQKLGKKMIQEILRRGKLPIICGGTGLYIDALIYEYALPEVPPNLRLRNNLENESTEALFKKLKKLDPRRAKNIDEYNRRRLIRALEIVLSTKKPIPTVREALERKSPYDIFKIGILFPNEILRERIHKRLIARIKQGMIKEVEKLHAQGLSWRRMEELGLEYRYISRYLRDNHGRVQLRRLRLGRRPGDSLNNGTLPWQLEKLNTEIWHYAKRQMTWFKRDKEIHWIQRQEEARKLVEHWLNPKKAT